MRKKKETYGAPVYSKKHNTEILKRSKSHNHSIINKHISKLDNIQNKQDKLEKQLAMIDEVTMNYYKL